MGQLIDAAAIFPLDAASHCGYEEENRDKRNICHDFYSLSSEVSLWKHTTVFRNQLWIFKIFFLLLECTVNSGKMWHFLASENNKRGCRNDSEMQPLLQPLRREGNSVSNYAPVRLGSTRQLGNVRLSNAYLWVPWNVFYVNFLFSDLLEQRLLLKSKLFMCYSFALLPWVFIPFAHQTAAIISAREADLTTVAGSHRTRPLWTSTRRLVHTFYRCIDVLVYQPIV